MSASYPRRLFMAPSGLREEVQPPRPVLGERRGATHHPDFSKMTALVLAAGLGTRLRAKTGGVPKPLVRIRGYPIVVRQIRWLCSQNVRRVWVNVHYRAEEVRACIQREAPRDVDIRFHYEPTLLGTAGTTRAIFRAAPELDRLIVVYGDNLTQFDLRQLIARHLRDPLLVTVALFDQRRHPHTGIAGGRAVADAQGFVVDFVEGSHDSSLVNAGVYVVERSLFDVVPDREPLDFGRDVFPWLLRSGYAVGAHIIDGYCLGLDTPVALRRGLELICQREVHLV